MSEIVSVPLSVQGRNDKCALVSTEDAERVLPFNWSYSLNTGGIEYAIRRENNERIYLHRFILNPAPELEVDHIDWNGLNCVRSNLRIVSHPVNCQHNRHPVGSSGHRGVYYHKPSRLWTARVERFGRVTSLGYFHTVEAAVERRRRFIETLDGVTSPAIEERTNFD